MGVATRTQGEAISFSSSVQASARLSVLLFISLYLSSAFFFSSFASFRRLLFLSISSCSFFISASRSTCSPFSIFRTASSTSFRFFRRLVFSTWARRTRYWYMLRDPRLPSAGSSSDLRRRSIEAISCSTASFFCFLSSSVIVLMSFSSSFSKVSKSRRYFNSLILSSMALTDFVAASSSISACIRSRRFGDSDDCQG